MKKTKKLKNWFIKKDYGKTTQTSYKQALDLHTINLYLSFILSFYDSNDILPPK